MQLVLGGVGAGADHHYGSVQAPATLLGRIQDDVRSNRAAPGAPLRGRPDERALLEADDGSIQIHSCHGRARQVEVVRDAILHALAEDESLEPRDVIVMCPDIETFAPLYPGDVRRRRAILGETTGCSRCPLTCSRRPTCGVRLADRILAAPDQPGPRPGLRLLRLELAQQRVTASQVLDLADRGPVRRRFRFDDDDLTRLEDTGSPRRGSAGHGRCPPRPVQARARREWDLAGRDRAAPGRWA